MNPALKTVLIIVSLFFCANHVSAKINNKYAEIAAKYHIHPFNLNYGYPVRYKWDVKPITGVIYLTDDFEFFEELSPRIYIAHPNAEDANLIANYYSDDIEFPKYYLIVDNTVEMVDLIVFMDQLMLDELEMEICFVGRNGKYVTVKYNNWSRLYDPSISIIVCGIYYTNIFDIMMNSMDDLLVNSNFTEIDSVDLLVQHCYSANLSAPDQDYNEFNYRKWNREMVLRRREKFESELLETPENVFFQHELEKIKKMNRLTAQFNKISEPPSNFYISLKKQRGTSLKAWYELLNQVQRGVHLARTSYFKKRFNRSYLELFYRHDPIYLELLEFTFPDRMMEREELPPPIEIIEEAPERPTLEPFYEDDLSEPSEPTIPPIHVDIMESEDALEVLIDSP